MCFQTRDSLYECTDSQENGNKALRCLKESTKKDPNYADAWSSLGELQGFMYSWGQLDAVVLDEALPNIERAIALEPNNAMYYVTKASSLNLQKKWEPMFASLDKALEISPNNAEVIAFCIGETTAQEAKKHFKDIRISKVPTVESVIELVNEHYI